MPKTGQSLRRLEPRQNFKLKLKEWTFQKRWNPFNSYKLLVHVDRWREIRRNRPVPPPVLITVDPTNVCNYNCTWCNAAYIRALARGLEEAAGRTPIGPGS